MGKPDEVHPNSPAGGGGNGSFRNPGALGTNPGMDHWMRPGPLGSDHILVVEKLKITGVIVAGGPLSQNTVVAVNKAATQTPQQWRRYIAYFEIVKVGGSLAWRANNPGNLRAAATKIGTVPGATGHFAVFASLQDGRAAQQDLYISKYGDMKVKDAINRLTPPNENDTTAYLAQLKAAGVDLDQDVKSQIAKLMPAVEASEGLIPGLEVNRAP